MSTRARRAANVLLCVIAGAALVGGHPRAQTSAPQSMSATERAAVAVVNEWLAGWAAKDPEKVSATMAEDAFWAGAYPDDPPNGGVSRGRARFRTENSMPIRMGVSFKMTDSLAVGGSAGTAVLIRRVDEFGFGGFGFSADGGGGGRGVWFTNAVFYWVKNGKVQIWYDIPTFFPPVPREQAPPLTTWAPQERAGLDAVNGWVAAWNAKDADKVASYMADDVLYSAYYPVYITERGKAHFLDTHRRNVTQGVNMRITQSHAVGGNQGTAVLVRRLDRVVVDGQQKEVPNAAFFWIVEGKIHTWLDLPVETPPKSATGTVVVR